MKLVLGLIISLMSLNVFSQTRLVSIDGHELAYTGALVFSKDKGKHDDRKSTEFKFSVNYAQNLEQYAGLMWKAFAYFNREDVDFGKSDSLTSELGLGGGLLYNFQADDIKNSVFASLVVGIERANYEFNDSKDESGFNLLTIIEGGKRFDLGQYAAANIAYAPSISVLLKRYGGDIRDEYFKSKSEVRFNFLKFDILF